MGNKRIYELAKEMNKSSKDVVEKAQQLGIDVKNHMGAITSSDEKKLQQAFKNHKEISKQHSKQAENQPNSSRTISLKTKQNQSTKK